MRYQLEKDGEKINDIICSPSFVEWYASQHGYTYCEIDAPEPTTVDTWKQERQYKIADLKASLSATDYQAIKYAEGWLTAEEYAPVKAQRQLWRDEINELEGE